jgi:hypothetical protein
MQPDTAAKTDKNRIFVVTIRRGEKSEPESYYMPAETAAIAELRVRRVAKAPTASVLNISFG